MKFPSCSKEKPISTLLIYGANGYSGRQIVANAVARGIRPIVAGRNAQQIEAVGKEFGLEHRCFDLGDAAAVNKGLARVQVVLHCAGPFSATSRPMLDACLRAGAHYLDITGEYRIFEAIADRDAELKRAGIMAMPGVALDIVPSDCLAAHMKRRMPDAVRLEIHIRALERLSRGTACSFIEAMGLPNVVRENGQLVERPAGADRRLTDFSGRKIALVGMPWGDISTAWRTTGIPNIAVFMSLMPGSAPMMRLGGFLRPLLQSALTQKFLKAQARRWITGPDHAFQESEITEFVAVAFAADGRQCKSYLQTKEGYAFTNVSATEIARRVLAGDYKPGYQTPGGLFGADFVLDIEGSHRTDLD